MRSFISFLVIVVILAAALFGIYELAHTGRLGKRPQVQLVRDRDQGAIGGDSTVAVGQRLGLTAEITAPKRICLVHVSLRQEANDVRIWEASGDQGESGTIVLGEVVAPLQERGFRPGPAELRLQVEDCSFFRRRMIRRQNVILDFTPPELQMTSTQHYVNQGGADLVTYKVSPEAVWSGLRVGPYTFKGYPRPGSSPESGERFAFFVFSYDLPPETKIEVVAVDEAGNESFATLTPARFYPKKFRQRKIPIGEPFVETEVLEIIRNTPEIQDPANNAERFLRVNRDLRKNNNRFLVDLTRQTDERFLWKDAFVPLGNASIEADFADERDYEYKGEVIDHQVHLGFDMAVTKNYPIRAANSGRVRFAGYLGIYGNTIVIDHGYGLFSLYAHLSGIDVKAGDLVEKDQKIGNSGATGLAAGDHLHFSMLIQGVQTNPIEFWDPHWIQDHIYLRLGKEAFGKND